MPDETPSNPQSPGSPGPPKLHIDADWKTQAQAEKRKLEEQAKQKATASGSAGTTADRAGATSGGTSGGRQMPEANFETLLATLATQAMYAMGGFPHPQTGQRVAHLDLARHQIDLLQVLEDKCQGNLTEEEETTLASTLYELRTRYVQVSSSAGRGSTVTA